MPGNHGPVETTEQIYKNAYEEGVRIHSKRKEQREKLNYASIQADKKLLGEVRKARHTRDSKWREMTKGNPLGGDALQQSAATEAHLQQTEQMISNTQKKGYKDNHNLYCEFLDLATCGEQEEEELKQLRHERRVLLERKQQIKAALEIRRRKFTGNVSRDIKSLVKVAKDNGYGLKPVSQAPPEKKLEKSSPTSQSLPSLGSTVNKRRALEEQKRNALDKEDMEEAQRLEGEIEKLHQQAYHDIRSLAFPPKTPKAKDPCPPEATLKTPPQSA